MELAVLMSGVLQALGYLFYLHSAFLEDIKPNPITWMMFSYGTLLLTFFEWQLGAEPQVLVLPFVCSLLSLLVMVHCFLRGTARIPSDWEEKIAFCIDIFLTICYAFTFYLMTTGYLNSSELLVATGIYLVFSNLTTLTAFYPLVIETVRFPEKERSLPWFVWGVAYTLLAGITYALEGTLFTLFMIYPLTNMILHFAVGVLALPRRKS